MKIQVLLALLLAAAPAATHAGTPGASATPAAPPAAAPPAAAAAAAGTSGAPRAAAAAPAKPRATAAASAKPRVAAAALKVRGVTLIAVNRAFTSFNERVEARPRERFPIGDTEYTARIVEFIPAFSMDLKTRKVFSYSKEPENPAFRIIVEKRGVPEDTTWAFMNMPPHFARNSMLAFLVQRVEFENHAPVEASKPGAAPQATP